MKHITTRFVLNFSGLLISLALFCTLPSNYFQDIYPEYNDIEAVTSASRDIQVTGGRAYSNYAILETYHKDSYIHHFIAYGPYGLFNDTLIVADTPRTHICTLTNLNSDLTYNFIFRGDFPGNPQLEYHSSEGIFRTVPTFHNHRSNQ